jgi:hypothetical protein
VSLPRSEPSTNTSPDHAVQCLLMDECRARPRLPLLCPTCLIHQRMRGYLGSCCMSLQVCRLHLPHRVLPQMELLSRIIKFRCAFFCNHKFCGHEIQEGIVQDADDSGRFARSNTGGCGFESHSRYECLCVFILHFCCLVYM